MPSAANLQTLPADQRCIVPATGFYEPDKANFPKPPHPWHYFRLKDEDLFGFAGLYDVRKDHADGQGIP